VTSLSTPKHVPIIGFEVFRKFKIDRKFWKISEKENLENSDFFFQLYFFNKKKNFTDVDIERKNQRD